MAGNSPENKIKPPVTVDRIVQIKKSDEQGEYVVLKFELFDDNEEIVRTTYFKYISAIQTENEQLAEQTAAKFFTLTRCSAFEVCEKAQDMRAVLAQTLRPTS